LFYASLVYTTGADHVPYGKLVIDRPVAVRETLKGIFLLQLHGEHKLLHRAFLNQKKNCCIEH